MSESEAAQGGWWQHNELRKAQGLPEEALDKDNPAHIQIVTDYARQHADRYLFARGYRDHIIVVCRFSLSGVSFRQVRGFFFTPIKV
jgi:hypothetical protein